MMWVLGRVGGSYRGKGVYDDSWLAIALVPLKATVTVGDDNRPVGLVAAGLGDGVHGEPLVARRDRHDRGLAARRPVLAAERLAVQTLLVDRPELNGSGRRQCWRPLSHVHRVY
jgi:hypothetical protein